MTLYRRRRNVLTSHRRQYNVILMSYAYWEATGNLNLVDPSLFCWSVMQDYPVARPRTDLRVTKIHIR